MEKTSCALQNLLALPREGQLRDEREADDLPAKHLDQLPNTARRQLPVAMRSSTMSILSPFSTASLCISSVAVPYSRS